jgi:MHS family proline/betaine transporter-like MFS transporter
VAAAREASNVTASSKRTALLVSFGGALEYYDFIVYGVFAAEIARAIFPARSPLVSLMASFGAFAIGYIARPVGGVVLSHFGDRFGRRRVFVVSLLGMSAATFGMGLVPTFAQCGVAAPMLMILLRLLQGFCLGGELPGAITYAVEVAPRKASFASGFVFFCVMFGVILATVLSFVIQTFLPPDLLSPYGWRIPFWVGGVLGLVGLWVRRSLDESPEFERVRTRTASRPFVELLRTQPQKVLIGVGLMATTGAFNGLLFAYMPAYLKTVLHVAPQLAVNAQNLALLIHTAALLLAAWLGLHIAPRLLMSAGTLLFALLSVSWYAAIDRNTADPRLVLMLAAVGAGLFNGTFAYLVADLFPTRIRFTGIALSMNIGMTLFSGLAPLIATSLIQSTGRLYAPGYFLSVAASLGFIASLFMKRQGGQILHGSSVATVAAPSTLLGLKSNLS